jgi:hypothetical protein
MKEAKNDEAASKRHPLLGNSEGKMIVLAALAENVFQEQLGLCRSDGSATSGQWE